MRFLCSIGILFFLTLDYSEAATQAPCSTSKEEWLWLDQTQQLKTCRLDIDSVDEEDFTISSVDDQLTLGFRMHHKKGVKYLPTNVFQVFPDLIGFLFYGCAITTVSRDHFKNLSNLALLNLGDNKIEHVASDAFVDLVSLEYLDLYNNSIQSLSADTFSTLKALKWLDLQDNGIQQLDPEIFSSLAKVETLNLQNNSIATLDEKIFDGLINLKEIHLSGNKLKKISGDLFRNNLKLERILLFENKIKVIDANVFDHLPSLRHVDLKSNVCWNRTYIKTFGQFDAMRSDLKRNCSAT